MLIGGPRVAIRFDFFRDEERKTLRKINLSVRRFADWLGVDLSLGLKSPVAEKTGSAGLLAGCCVDRPVHASLSAKRKKALVIPAAPFLPCFCFCREGGIRLPPKMILACLFSTLPLAAQYPGQEKTAGTEATEVRSIAVLEWTGEAGKPKTSRLVPVAVLDQGQLQDGGIYLARPAPLALAGEVEYELQQNGQPVGLFDLKNAGQEQGAWVGYGAWKPLAAPQPKPSMDEVARNRIVDDDQESDEPILHRKHHADEDSSAPGKDDAGKGSGSSAGAPAPDPDRPTLHKKDSSDAAESGSAPPDDPDRPVLKKNKKKPEEEVAHVDSLPDVTDPDRPRLKRGKYSGNGLDVVPTLMGLPADMQQAVAVSDAKSSLPHPWSFSWANPEDEATMKTALEAIAREALGLNPPPVPQTPKKTAHKSARPSKQVEAPLPAPLADENFRVFELAYGSSATLVLTAHSAGPLAEQKFVTLIAQPDLYGNVLVLLKYVASGAHLDETPRMRLIDAVDAMADNRGELLFELRGATQRQFALYRVLRGQAEKIFVTGGGEFGTEAMN